METNEIKKELYKQKPMAEYDFQEDGFTSYSTVLVADGIEEIIQFKIPNNECQFEKTVPAQLLIRWMI